MSQQTIAVVGLGLIGGSAALALSKNKNYRIVGVDNDSSVLEKAASAADIHPVNAADLGGADIIIIALSPENALGWLENNVKNVKKGAIITDVCGVKRTIVSRFEHLCHAFGVKFVGGHPMAGRERGGFANADAKLFYDCSYILTPTEATDKSALDRVRQLAFELGAGEITTASPEEHDRMIAFTSQLPHVLSGAYVRSPQCANHLGFSAGSFRDVSRVAAIDENLWADLFMQNADYLYSEIDMFMENLEQMKAAVLNRDRDKIAGIIKIGRQRKEGVNYDQAYTQHNR